MTLTPFLNASPIIQAHTIAAITALFLGAFLLLRKKGTPTHRLAGYIWVICMVIAAGSSFFINEIRLLGPYSPIHILSVLTFVSLVQSIRAVRRGDLRTHKIGMQSLYSYGLIIAGAFTLFPGRIAHRVLFGQDTAWGYALIGAIAIVWVGFRFRSSLGARIAPS